MAKEINENDPHSAINLIDDNLLELQCLIKVTGICYSARCEIGRRQLLAFTTTHMDIGILYQPDTDCWPRIKRIPWYQSQNRNICALGFDPTGSWLLTATIEGSIYIVPVLALFDDHHVSDQKWSINDVTPIPIINQQYSYCRPSALAWWQGIAQYSQTGILGTEEGEIIFINLQNGQWINSTRVSDSIATLDICQDNNLEIVSLLITSKSQRQWRVTLEQRINGCIYLFNNGSNVKTSSVLKNGQCEPGSAESKISNSTRSRLRGLKQLSVEKLGILKQKLAETRSHNVKPSNFYPNSKSSHEMEESLTVVDTASKFISQTSNSLVLEPLSEDLFLSSQYTQHDQHLFTAYRASTNHITVRNADFSVVPLHIYKMPGNCRKIVLTQRLFFVTGPSQRSVWVISCPLCKMKMDEEPHFNSDAVIAQFRFENTKEFINGIYRATDLKKLSINDNSKGDIHRNKPVLTTKIEDLDIEVPLVDTCVVVTNYGVYKIVFAQPLLSLFIDLVSKSKESDMKKVAQLGVVFGMDVPQLFECAGDIHLAKGRFTEAAELYKLSRCRLLKGVLKTAAAGHTSKLLECLSHCLTPPAASELITTTRIHLSNLTVFAFCELILRATPQDSERLYKHFLLFLSRNTFYDERWVVDVAGYTCLWKVLHHLITQRGLQAQVLEVLIRTIQSYSASSHSTAPPNIEYGVLICISEPSIIQAMLASPILARGHMTFVLNNLSDLPLFALQRLVILYDPTNPTVRPLLTCYRARRRTSSRSSQTSQCDSLDSSDVLEESLLAELVETFLLVLLTLISKIPTKWKHNPALIGHSHLPSIVKCLNEIVPKVDFKRRLLSAGYGHVALIRNGNIYTWGNSNQGCLGTGPSISRYGTPQLVTFFCTMNVEILNISCGRCHTLAVTNNGVYAWGGSQYGQLGLGRVLQTPNPELIIPLAQEIVVDAVAGQYHSVALTMDGRVLSWGWGVHGQLGHGDTHQKNVPTVVTSLVGIVVRAIAAGHAHTLTLSADGNIYAFGCNIFGQLGIGNNIKSSYPIKITLLPEPISEIATGYFHNLAVSTTNKVYTWGASPQVLRLQTQAQKKSKLLEFQAAAEKHTENLNEFNSDPMATADNYDIDRSHSLMDENATEIEQFAIKNNNVKKLNCSNKPTSTSLRDINLGLIEEAQTHLKPVLIDTSQVNGRIVQISTGCHHSALLTKDGTVYCWGRNLDGQIGNGTRRDVNIPIPLTYNPVPILVQVPPRSSTRTSDPDMEDNKFSATNFGGDHVNDNHDHLNRVIKAVRVCCGCEFTIAIEPGGTILSWGSNSIAQLGRSPTKESGSITEKLLVKSSKRVVRVPHGSHIASDTPSQVPHIPAPIITYQSYDITPLAGRIRPLSLVEKTYGEFMLHYALEQFDGLYDAASIVDKCDELRNYQARSKLALLQQHFSTALAYQLKSLFHDNYIAPIFYTSDTYGVNVNELAYNQITREMKGNMELFVKHVESNLDDTIMEYESKMKMKMSISRSLDSINVMEQELHTFDCQGGSEELCAETNSSNISLNVTEGMLDNAMNVEGTMHLFQNIYNDSIDDYGKRHSMRTHVYIPVIFDNQAKIITNNLDTLMHNASNIIRFYIYEIDENSQKILCQILQTVFDFWITSNLPMITLENILNLFSSKFFYPLGLLFFQNGIQNDDVDENRNDTEAIDSTITNNLSTKFCLEICATILRYIEEGKPIFEYVELFSLMTEKYYGPPLRGYPESREKTAELMMKGIISTISSKSSDPRQFIHMKHAEMVSRFLELEEDTIVFTCAHHFLLSIYQSEIIPNMEAELLIMQPLSLPCTTQILGNILSRIGDMQIKCPRCVRRAIQIVIKNLMYK